MRRDTANSHGRTDPHRGIYILDRYLCVLVPSFNNPREPGTGLEEKFPGTPAAIPTDWESADVE